MNFSVGIVGLGRIGRGVLRNNFAQAVGGRFDIKVVCDVMPINQVAYLLSHDSTYGNPPFSLTIDGDNLIVNGKPIKYQRVDRRRGNPQDAGLGDLREFELDVLFDATGTATNDDFRTIIRQNIAKKTLCTWNVAGLDISLVYGVNHGQYDSTKHDVICASTCTGNALTPIFHILAQHIGIDYARVITIHPTLSDQKVLDGYHVNPQYGRTYNESIIPTSTNVGHSTTLVIPALTGKIDSFSYRVPNCIVSAMDISARLSRDTTIEECSELFKHYAQNSLNGIILCDYGSFGHQKVSIDYLKTPYSAVILMQYLTVHGCQLGLSLMHDNEWAYCCRVLDILGVLNSAKEKYSLN